MKKKFFFALFLVHFIFQVHGQRTVSIFSRESPQARIAIERIEESLIRQNFKVNVHFNSDKPSENDSFKIILATPEDEKWVTSIVKKPFNFRTKPLEKEGFHIQRAKDKENVIVLVRGKDLAGLLYGGFELAEIISVKELDAVTEVIQSPYMKRRGVKMNIPLDVRTPSYTDLSDAGQQNIAEMWSMDFWKEYLDSLASYRYNFVSLWNLHPFPSMVKVPEYPDVALNDVHRSRATLQENYSTRGTGLDAPDIVNNYEILKKISIDEKIRFWQDVMRYAKDRNIEFYIVTWNIYTCGATGKYGITDDFKNPVTKDYYRKSIKQLFITYPLLAGIGLTTGENMPGADFQEKEDWAYDTYGLGVLDVSALQPQRKITFIHRQHEAGALEIVKKFKPVMDNKNVNFVFSFKYAQAHVYSATKQVHHMEFEKQIKSVENLKTLWTLRNDDVFYFRWGSPDFVREFIKNIPFDISEGYYYGSDQYIWGREFLDKFPGAKREIEIAKHWYHWMIWGRLGYNPNMQNERFIDLLQNHFPGADSKVLFDAWQSASLIYPITTGFHYGALDFQWYIEAGKSRPEPAQTASGFHDINRFITLAPYAGTDFVSIPDYVKSRGANTQPSGTTPFEVADSLNESADRALKLVQTISIKGSKELYNTVEDIKAISYLGKYYAYKINAATHLGLLKSNAKPEHREAMLRELAASSLYWRYYASTALARYKNPLWTNRVGYVDWRDLYGYTLKDILDQGGEIKLPHMEPTAGGRILEAELAETDFAKPDSQKSGFTGSGYVAAQDRDYNMKWNFDAPQSGKYVLEFRYISKVNTLPMKDTMYVAGIAVGGKSSASLVFWPGGSDQNWVWDKVEVDLTQGKQDISLTVPKDILLDHVNVFRY
jgi:hypothetical protein